MAILPRDDLKNRIMARLASDIVDVELGPIELEECVRTALQQYRNRSSNSVEEGYFFLELQPNKNEYILPQEIDEVREIFRRGVGRTSGGILFDPFSANATNYYMLQAGAEGGLTTYYLYTQYQELVGTLFGEHIMFSWNPTKKLIKLARNITSPETVLLWAYYHRLDDDLIKDPYGGLWILNYSLAYAKVILGLARGKFATIIGPQSGSTLDGESLKTQGYTEIAALEQELLDLGYGEAPLYFIIG